MERVCKDCGGAVKPGRGRCEACMTKHTAEYHKEYYRENKARIDEGNKLCTRRRRNRGPNSTEGRYATFYEERQEKTTEINRSELMHTPNPLKWFNRVLNEETILV